MQIHVPVWQMKKRKSNKKIIPLQCDVMWKWVLKMPFRWQEEWDEEQATEHGGNLFCVQCEEQDWQKAQGVSL